MKKLLLMILCVVFVFSLTACEKKEEGKVYDGNAAETSSSAQKDTSPVDLTKLNFTMFQSTVNQIINTPDDYIGRSVTLKGTYTVLHNDDNTQTYSACIQKDSTGCCTPGFEFVLKDGIEYPKENQEITVTGILETYEEDGTTYCRLADAELV